MSARTPWRREMPEPGRTGTARVRRFGIWGRDSQGRPRGTQTMPVLPGAEPYRHEGDRTGVLLCHGFTGSPQSLRPWAEYLAEAGLTVSLPRLPGHGTTWQEMAGTRWEDWYAEVDRSFDELHASTGLVLVNPSITAETKLFLLAPVLKFLVPSLKGVANDIKKPGSTELGYD